MNIKRTFFAAIALFALTVPLVVAPSAFADVQSACKSYQDNNPGGQGAACRAGYGGASCSVQSAANRPACQAGADAKKKETGTTGTTGGAASGSTGGNSCGGVQTGLIVCDETKPGESAIGELIKIAIGIITVLVGIVAVGSLGYAGALWAASRDNAGQTKQAMDIIRNTVIGLLMYGFMVAIVNFLVAGSVIK